MERRLHNDEFEDLLREKSDQFRMYPSDKVWKEIHKTMHPRRKWYWIGVALLLTGAGYQFADQIISPTPIAVVSQSSNPEIINEQVPEVKQPAELIPFKSTVDLKSVDEIRKIPPVNTRNAFATSPRNNTKAQTSSIARVIPMDFSLS